jgi:hypothetical protein
MEQALSHAYYLHRRRLQRRFSGAVIHAGQLTDHRSIAKRFRLQFSWSNFRRCCLRAVESVFAWSYLPKGIAERLGPREQAMGEPMTGYSDLLTRIPGVIVLHGFGPLIFSNWNVLVSRISSTVENYFAA